MPTNLIGQVVWQSANDSVRVLLNTMNELRVCGVTSSMSLLGKSHATQEFRPYFWQFPKPPIHMLTRRQTVRDK